MAGVNGEAGPGGGGSRPLLKLAVLVALVVGGLLLVSLTPLGERLSREGVRDVVETLRGTTWAPAFFVALYAGATALAVPGSVLTLVGGAVFGVVHGTLYNWMAANLGANAAFALARYLGRGGIERLAGERLQRLDRATREHGFQSLLALRLIPAVPFNALNFGAGLTAIPWSTYAVATAVGIFPGTLVYTMFADALLAGSTEASREAFVRVAVSGGLLVLLSFLPTAVRKMGVTLPGQAARLLLLAAVATAAGASSHPVPSPGDGARGPEGAPGAFPPVQVPDHAPFTALLRAVVREPRVDYALLQRRRGELDAYLARLAATDPTALAAASTDARLAFWINAYNACMLRRVVEHYPIEGGPGLVGRIRNLVAGYPANSVWQIEDVFTGLHCRIAGQPRSQDQIEHEILRPMGDPRIHFAVNCAAVSCPPLIAEAYEPGRVDAQLDGAVERFLAEPRHFRLEPGTPATVRLNRVLDWYGDDFGGTEGLKAFLAGYLTGEGRARLLSPATQVAFFEYDWTLNDLDR